MAVKYTKEQLNTIDKSLLIDMFLNMQDQLEALTRETHELNDKMQKLMEQVILANNYRFGRKSEKMEDPHQITMVFVDGEFAFFNEAEAHCNLDVPDEEELEVTKRRGKKRIGKREEDMKDLPVERIDHYMSDEALTEQFGTNGWNQLGDEVSKLYRFVPAQVTVEEHHVGVYAAKNGSKIIRAPHPKRLLNASPATPSLVASALNAKYVNALPFNRLEQEYERYGLAITRQNLCNWTIRCCEEYLGVLYDYLHQKLYDYHVIQADETPVLVNKDGRNAGSKSYMWVYRSGYMYPEKQIILYEYQKTRNSSHPETFLKDFNGICVTDGYEVYHTVEKKLDGLTIAGCWVHARRKFEDAEKVLPKDQRNKSMAHLILNQIRAIYREDKKLKELSSDERLRQRQLTILPLVDALFAYLKSQAANVPGSGTLHDAVTYIFNQEQYLRVFLTDGDVPMDNNASERAIRGFCIGKKNWEVVDTIRGAQCSAIAYSIAETAKANGLKPYEYYEFLLTEIPKHMDDKDRSFLEDLAPWSEKLPARIKKPMK